MVGGDVAAGDAADGVEDGGGGDGKGGVDAAGSLTCGALEVGGHVVALDGEGDGDGNQLVGLAVVVHVVEEVVAAVGDAGNGGASAPFGVVEDGVHVLAGGLHAVAFGDFAQAAGTDADGGNLRSEVALALLGGAGVPADEFHDLGVDAAAADDPEGRDDGAFLVKLGGEGEGAGGHTADVGVMAPVGDEASEFLVVLGPDVDGGHHGDVGEVGAS